MSDSIVYLLDFFKNNPYVSPILAALITAIFAVIVVVITVFFQKRIAADKIRNDNALKLVDEYFEEDFFQTRQLLYKYLNKKSDNSILSIALDSDLHNSYRKTANFFEKLNGMVISKRVDTKLIQEILGTRIEFWYVNIVENTENSDVKLTYDWKSTVGRLRTLKKICRNKYLMEERKNLKNRSK